MVTIQIGDGEPQDIERRGAGWIAHQLMRRAAGGGPCVRFSVRYEGAVLDLCSQECFGPGVRGNGHLTSVEQYIVDLWMHSGLDDGGLSAANVIRFTRQMRAFGG